MTEFEYVGDELTRFARATNWKRYLRAQVRSFTRGHVLEVGAGLGGTTRALINEDVERWVCLEPDSSLAAPLQQRIDEGELPQTCEVVVGTLESYGQRGFDCVLYIDVLEHIEGDRAELERAAERLVAGGHVIALSPAHPFLYSPFDAAIGHFRRYTKTTLRAIAPETLQLVRLRYLDAIGFFASAANRTLLRSSMPSVRQIGVWDKLMVPISRLVDPVARYSFGKSVLAVWRKKG